MALRDEIRRAIRTELTRRCAAPGELARLMGCSSRTARRVVHGGDYVSIETMEMAMEALHLKVSITRG